MAVAVVVPAGVYCTMIVQVPPAAMDAPEMQVPPVIANVPPGVPTLVTIGLALSVRFPLLPVGLVTVMVPV